MTKEQLITEIFNDDPCQLLEEIKISEHKCIYGVQYVVRYNNLTLVQTITGNFKSNDCSIGKGDYSECCSQHDKRFADLFIALYNYKH